MQPALLAVDADEYIVTRSLEAYLLWLFGYIMFNNTHGNSVDRILLPYAQEIADGDEDVPPYSWGEAILAATYRGLCDGCMKTHGNAILSGYPLLLQLWSYERLAVGRPLSATSLTTEACTATRRTRGPLWELSGSGVRYVSNKSNFVIHYYMMY